MTCPPQARCRADRRRGARTSISGTTASVSLLPPRPPSAGRPHRRAVRRAAAPPARCRRASRCRTPRKPARPGRPGPAPAPSRRGPTRRRSSITPSSGSRISPGASGKDDHRQDRERRAGFGEDHGPGHAEAFPEAPADRLAEGAADEDQRQREAHRGQRRTLVLQKERQVQQEGRPRGVVEHADGDEQPEAAPRAGRGAGLGRPSGGRSARRVRPGSRSSSHPTASATTIPAPAITQSACRQPVSVSSRPTRGRGPPPSRDRRSKLKLGQAALAPRAEGPGDHRRGQGTPAAPPDADEQEPDAEPDEAARGTGDRVAGPR